MKWDNTDAAGRGSHHRMLMRGWRLLGQWTLPAVVGARDRSDYKLYIISC